MRQIQSGIVDYRLTAGKSAFLERSSGNRYLSHSIFDTRKQISASAADLGWISSSSARSLPEKERSAPFVPAGQSTQMIIGATKENDYQLLSTSQLLYQQYDLKRVFYPPTFRSTRIPPCPHVKPRRRFGNTAFIRQTGCSASTVFRRMNYSMKPTRTFMHSSTRNATGRCAIWSCFRWRSTRLSMPTFCAFRHRMKIGHADKEPQKLPSFLWAPEKDRCGAETRQIFYHMRGKNDVSHAAGTAVSDPAAHGRGSRLQLGGFPSGTVSAAFSV